MLGNLGYVKWKLLRGEHRPTDQVGNSALLFVVDALQERPQHRGGARPS